MSRSASKTVQVTRLNTLFPVELPLDGLDEHPRNPRRTFDDEALAGLVESIRSVGVLQPILVRPKGERHEIVCGHRRTRAAKIAGLAEIPVVVRDLDDREAALAQLVENSQRSDVPPLDESCALARLVEAGVAEDELAARTGRTLRWVRDRLRLQNLVGDYHVALERGELPLGGALLLAALPPERQEELASTDGWGGLMPTPDGEDFGEAWTIRRVQDVISRGLLSLAKVPWSMDDATLGGNGACSRCPLRTGAQPDLWETSRDDRCLDTVCFAGHRGAWLGQQQASGTEIRRGEYLPYNTHFDVAATVLLDGVMALAVYPDVPRTVFVSDRGEVSIGIDRQMLAGRLRADGRSDDADRVAPRQTPADDWKARQKNAATATRERQKAHDLAVAHVAENLSDVDTDELRLLLATFAIASASSDALRTVSKRRKIKLEKGHLSGNAATALQAHATTLDPAGHDALLVELLVESLRDKYCDGPGIKAWRALQRATGLDVPEPEPKAAPADVDDDADDDGETT